MIYHLGGSFKESVIGRTKAITNRLSLFKKNKIDSKIIDVVYNSNEDFKSHGIAAIDYKNMYDYFQNIDRGNLVNENIKIQDIFPFEEHSVRFDSQNVYIVYKNNIQISVVYCGDDGYTIKYITYFNIDKKRVKRTFYNTLGFISHEQFLRENTTTSSEIYYTQSGVKAIEKFYSYEEGKNLLSLIKLYKDNKILFFFTEEELIQFYLESILTEKDIIINDKHSLYIPILAKMETRIKNITILHGNRNTLALKNSTSLPAAFGETSKGIDTFLVSTKSQKNDILKHLEGKVKVYDIPVGYNEDLLKANSSNEAKIICVARISREKRLEDAIVAFSKIKDEIKEATLHLIGGGASSSYGKELKAIVSDLGLTSSVYFRGNITNIIEEYQSSKIKILTSEEESFSLAIMEAASYGIPVVAYDIKYGPSDLIEHEKTGFLTKEDPLELADRVIQILKDEKLHEKMSKSSYNKIKNEFSKKAVWEKWKQLLDDLGY